MERPLANAPEELLREVLKALINTLDFVDEAAVVLKALCSILSSYPKKLILVGIKLISL
jgi:hypothetical protein